MQIPNIKKLFNYKNFNIEKDFANNFFTRFFESDFHQWITDDSSLKRSFQVLLNFLPKYILKDLENNGNVAFIPSNGKWACAIYKSKKEHVILVFPDLIKLLRSGSYLQGVAILAHELGHVLLGHGKEQLSPLEAQYQADLFVAKIGLGTDLIMFLKNYPENDECLLRLDHLMSLSANSEMDQ